MKKEESNNLLVLDLNNKNLEMSNVNSQLQLKDKKINQLNEVKVKYENELDLSREKLTNLTAQNKGFESRLEEKEKVISSYMQQFSDFKKEVNDLNSAVVRDKAVISELQTTIDKEREMSQEKLSLLNEAKEKLSIEFQNLGNKIFEDKSKKFDDQNKKSMENLLNPLREQIKDFDKKVSDTYEKDSKERVSLKVQIDQLKNLNERISEDAINLTNALKGQTKAQGSWGEVILEKVLEMSGLRNGQEYTTQDSFKSWHGKTFRPDVVIHLPEGKQVVIDAKVSLTAYEKYSSTDDADEKLLELKNHLRSLNNHIKGLSTKSYEDLEGINSLNYVLMFIPIESAFMLAIENDKNIFKSAFDKNIILVCPSTLLATLRTIQSIWQFEYQNKNAMDIADRAGKLHDRFVEFLGHMQSVGSRLNQASRSYEDAMKAISEGRGNLVNQVKQLEKLGAKAKKSIPRELDDEKLGEAISQKEEDDDSKDLPLQFSK